METLSCGKIWHQKETQNITTMVNCTVSNITEFFIHFFSALTMQTSYEEAYHKTGSQDRGRSAYSSANTAGMRYKDR